MSARPGTAGATRTCPHCKTTILESSSICPSCRHYLRFDAAGAQPAVANITPLHVEGKIRHPAEGGAWEYSVVLVIRDDEGNEIARQVVGVGAMLAGEERTFSLAVEVMPTNDMRRPAKRGTKH
jgi:RNA polymerase subunit RPABC4/transcription elongation factor Spt4